MFIENSSFNMDKGNVYQTIRKEIDSRIFKLQQALKSQKESLSSASESTAGDKHNTSRAMMHMEEEKLGQQMIQLEQLKRLIQKINPENTLLTIGLGSLVKTNRELAIHCCSFRENYDTRARVNGNFIGLTYWSSIERKKSR